MRVNLSINIIAMVQQKSDDGGNSTEIVEDYGPRYAWTNKEQSILLGSFFWGYLISSLPGGVLAERFGGKSVVGYSLFLSCILTALTPLAASINFWVIFCLRFLTGVLGGVLYPANHYLIARWAPGNEKGKFISTLMGGTFGTVITWPLSGLIVEALGWIWAFYITALISAAVVVLWFLCVTDTPAEHKYIKQKEVEYIKANLGNVSGNSKKWPPFKSVLTSMPFWALLVLHYGSTWGLHFSLTATPKFLSEVLGFNLTKAGFLSSAPHLARILLGFVFGTLGDVVRRRQLLSVTNIRKTFCIFSHILPGVCLIFLAYAVRDPYICVGIITLSLGLNGATTVTNLQNSQDLAPNYAGTIYGFINFVGVTPGFFAPILVAYFTEEQNTLDEWLKVFLVGAVIYIAPAILFAIFGSGEVQPWNDDEPASKPEPVVQLEADKMQTSKNESKDTKF